MLVYHCYKVNMPYHNNYTHAHIYIVILDDECKWCIITTTMLFNFALVMLSMTLLHNLVLLRRLIL